MTTDLPSDESARLRNKVRAYVTYCLKPLYVPLKTRLKDEPARIVFTFRDDMLKRYEKSENGLFGVSTF